MINFDDIGSVVSFDTYAPNILGATQARMTILGIVDHSSVSTFQPDIKHQEVYAYLPANSPKRYTEYSYLKVRDENDNIHFFGLPWVKMNTVRRHEGKTVVIRINNYPISNIPLLRRMLASFDIINYTIEAD